MSGFGMQGEQNRVHELLNDRGAEVLQGIHFDGWGVEFNSIIYINNK